MSIMSSGWKAICFCCLILSACATSLPSRHYTIVAAATSTEVDSEGPSIGLGPIRFPEYLDRPQIVIRGQAGEVTIEEFHRWIEPLHSTFMTVLAEDVAIAIGRDEVYAFPWPTRVKPDLRIMGTVSRFDALSSGQAQLAVQWQIVDRSGEVIGTSRRSSYSSDWTPGDFREMALALSRTVVSFSEEIAAVVAAIDTDS